MKPVPYLFAFMIFVAVALLVRVPLPVDETRYLSVAWEMWRDQSWLVPVFNGEPYSHKPPLLFWLIHAGWLVFGVNELWPRLLSPVLSVIALLLTIRVACRLWPDSPRAGFHAAVLLGCSAAWLAGSTLIQFDLLLTCCVLIVMLGTLDAAHGRYAGWLLAGLGMGLGILAKGPVVFLHTLPVMLSMPYWADRPVFSRRNWLAGVVSALSISVAIALAWAWPAGLAGGADYRAAIFWGQYAGRIGTDTPIHQAPVWFYLAWLPIALLPWSLSAHAWRASRIAWAGSDRKAVRVCLIWFISTLILFSMIGSKNLKYLLPSLPALALLTGYGLSYTGSVPVKSRIPFLLLVSSGLFLLVIGVTHFPALPGWTRQISSQWGIIPVGIAAITYFLHTRQRISWLAANSLAMWTVFVVIHAAVGPAARTAYDVTPLALRIAEWQQRKVPVLNAARYHDQYAFAGRLRAPLEDAVGRDAVTAWITYHPQGRVIVYTRDPAGESEEVVYRQAYRGGYLSVWKARYLQAHLDLLPASSRRDSAI